MLNAVFAKNPSEPSLPLQPSAVRIWLIALIVSFALGLGHLSATAYAQSNTCQNVPAHGPIDATLCGMAGDNKTDNSSAIKAWTDMCMATHRPCYLPAGQYIFTQPLVLDLSPVRAAGITFYGDGANATKMIFETTSSPAFQIECSVCAVNSNPLVSGYTAGQHGAFYSNFHGFHITGTLAGSVLRIGLPADPKYPQVQPDAMNGFTFDDMVVNNSLADPRANAVEINGMFSSRIWMTTNTHEQGDSLRLKGVAYSTISGSYSGADTGIHITGGHVFGNVFNNLDVEVVKTGVVIDTAGANDNTFISGVYALKTLNGSAINAVVNATQGNDNMFINPFTAKKWPFFAEGGKADVGVSVVSGSLTGSDGDGSAGSIGAGACQTITQTCQSAGYTAGKGLLSECINPLMQGTHGRSPLPKVDPSVIASCHAQNPKFGSGPVAR